MLSLVYFHLFEALNGAFNVQIFSGLNLHLIKDTNNNNNNQTFLYRA